MDDSNELINNIERLIILKNFEINTFVYESSRLYNTISSYTCFSMSFISKNKNFRESIIINCVYTLLGYPL